MIVKPTQIEMMVTEMMDACRKHAMRHDGTMSFRLIQTAMAHLFASFLVQLPELGREAALDQFVANVRERAGGGISVEKLPRPIVN